MILKEILNEIQTHKKYTVSSYTKHGRVAEALSMKGYLEEKSNILVDKRVYYPGRKYEKLSTLSKKESNKLNEIIENFIFSFDSYKKMK